jgi:hypothetical protein
MHFNATSKIQAAPILVILLAAGLATTVRAQGIMTKGFSAVGARGTFEQNTPVNQLLTVTSPTLHQAVGTRRTPQQRRSSRYTVPQRVAAAVVMGFAGFWIGGKVGETVNGGNCCGDDPYVGFMIGAPIGAAVGTTLGIVLTR